MLSNKRYSNEVKKIQEIKSKQDHIVFAETSLVISSHALSTGTQIKLKIFMRSSLLGKGYKGKGGLSDIKNTKTYFTPELHHTEQTE